MVDVSCIYDRFLHELELMKDRQYEIVAMRFTETELKQIIYILGELKALKGETRCLR